MFADLKKILLLIAIMFLTLPVAVEVAQAQDAYGIGKTADVAGIGKSNLGLSRQTVPDLVGDIVAVALSFVGIAFFLLALYAGLLWMSARGNTDRVDKAKDILEAAVIGLILIIGAYALTRFVFERLGVAAGPTGSGGSSSATVLCAPGFRNGASCGTSMVCSCGAGSTAGDTCNTQGTCITACEFGHNIAKPASNNASCQNIPAGQGCPPGQIDDALSTELCPQIPGQNNLCCFDGV